MFINSSHLKKLMTTAYKGGGIQIGYIDEGYVILGGRWGVWLDVNYIPNKIKAIIMELAGTLPEEDTIFSVSKENPMPQLTIDTQDYTHINILQREAKIPVAVTGVLLDKKYSVYSLLQVAMNNELIMMDTNLINLIDFSEIDHDQEGVPAGPCTNFGQAMYFWRNATCTLLLIGETAPKGNPVIQALSRISFAEEVKK
nr:hypothetical protein [uncultured Anaerocolumna sp.]